MAGDFRAEVFQNEYLPSGSGEVHAIMTVTAGAGTAPAAPARLFGIVCDVSGSMEGGKIVAAKAAMAKLVTMLPADTRFFVVTGSDMVRLVSPVAPASEAAKQQALAG